MRVVATAGHVDHGKSTLVRALTGMEPDRWAEERRRGMTIDLGYAWTDVADETLVFVDVPGHERFLANTLAGLGPAPAVLLVVAADQGWQAQSAEHLAALAALDLRHLLVAVTRTDLADPRDAEAVARAACAAAGYADVAVVPVSARSGNGLDELRAALLRLVRAVPRPRTDGRVRLWLDRAFTVAGAGTVVTGTLTEGAVTVGDELELNGMPVVVRGLQALGRAVDRIAAPARVAVNLRGVARGAVRRGDVLLTPGAWRRTTAVDVRVRDSHRIVEQQVLHVGTAAVPVRVRPLGDDTARLQVTRPLPLVHGDRAVLREPGTRTITGVEVLDAEPPPLRRRGAAARRAVELAATPDAAGELGRRGAMRIEHLEALGFDPTRAGGRVTAGWLVSPDQWSSWTAGLRAVVDESAAADPLSPGLPTGAAVRMVELPDPALLPGLVEDAGLIATAGVVRTPTARPSLGAAEPAVAALELRLRATPFRAPEQTELAALGLGRRQLAVAARTGRVVELAGGVVLLADAPQRAATVLQGLPQPFTVSAARQALDTTRRVAVPLLEHLDRLGLTERVDATSRRVRKATLG